MEDIQLSPKAQQQQVALRATNEHLLAEGAELEVRTRALEELAQRKENMVRRYQELLTEIQTERQAIEADYQRIRNMSLSHQ